MVDKYLKIKIDGAECEYSIKELGDMGTLLFTLAKLEELRWHKTPSHELYVHAHNLKHLAEKMIGVANKNNLDRATKHKGL